MLPADKKKDFLFRTCPSDALQGVVLGKLAASLYKSASVMYVNNPYGQGLADQFRRSFHKRGGTVYTMIPHAEEVADSYVADLRHAYARVYLTKPFRSGKSDVLCVFSYPEHAKVYVKEAIEVFDGKAFLFSDGSKSEKIAEAAGAENLAEMKKMFGDAVWTPIPLRTIWTEIARMHSMVWTVAPESRAAADAMTLGKQFMEVIENV